MLFTKSLRQGNRILLLKRALIEERRQAYQFIFGAKIFCLNLKELIMARLARGERAVFALATCFAFPFGALDAASAAPRPAGRYYAGRHQGWHGGRAYGYRGGYHYGGNAGAAAAAGIVGGIVAGAVAAGVAAWAQPY
jgi:hypothetical protein